MLAFLGLQLVLALPGTIDELITAGRYAEAEAAARAWVQSEPAVAPGQQPQRTFVAARAVLARALVANGHVATGEATASARAALEAALGLWPEPDAAEIARIRATLGSTLLAQARRSEAGSLLIDALRALRAAAIPDKQALAEALTTYADLLLEQEDPAQALAAVDEARRWIAGDDASSVAEARLLDLAAAAHQFQGRWDLAREALDAAERRRAEAGQTHHPQAVVTQLLLGDTAWNAGDMTTAEAHYIDALAVADQTLREGHPLRTRALGRLGSWEAEMGLIERALPRHREAVRLARDNLGATHPRMADYLNDLANAVMLAGEPEAAVSPLQEALAIGERVYGTESPYVATPIYNLAGAYADAGDWQAALAPMARAAAIWVKAFGEDDPRVRRAYKSWADCLAGSGDDTAAVGWYERALALRLRAGERDHPATARLRVGLAAALERLGRAERADQAAAEAERVLRDLVGWREQELARALAIRARLAAARRGADLAPALRWAREGDGLRERHVRSTVRFLGERQALRYLGERFDGRDLLLQMLTSGRRHRALAREAMELVIRQRNVVLDELIRRAKRSATAGASDPAWQRLTAARRRTAGLLYRGAALQADLRAAGQALEEAERAAAWDNVTPRSADEPAGLVQRLAASLRPRSALVSVATVGARGGTTERQYVAFVLRAGQPEPRVVTLGAAQELERLVARWRTALSEADVVGDRGSDALALRAGRDLARALWEPVRTQLGRVERVYVVPDGVLHLVNFAALVDDAGHFLVERGPTLHVLSSERQLLQPPRRERPRSALIAAGPDFDAAGALRTAAAVPAHDTDRANRSAPGTALWRGQATSCADLGRLQFEPLPAARGEGDDVRNALAQAHIDATLLASSAASESAMKSAAGGHDILHVASHGFALNPTCAAGAPDPASSTRLSPLLFAGLALAGANRRQLAAPDDEDGILTAEEIAALPMRDGAWVVLSGCETAVGGVRPAEGVMGLRRAFAVSGASTVVMSLWRVQDVYARRWMSALYRARFHDGLDTAEAVRAASQSVLAQLRASGQSTTPARWGAFVATGDWR